MKLILSLTITTMALTGAALGQNVRVTNDPTHPVPVIMANPSPAPSPAVAVATAANQTNGQQKTQIDQTTPGTTNGVQVNAALPAGANVIGKVSIDQTTAGATNAVQSKQYTGTPSNFAVGSTDQTVFTLAAGEIGFIQNLSSDAALAVKKGASASTSSFNFILATGSANDDGKGGAVRIDDWVGVVSVAKISGTARYIAWKQAP